VKLSRVCALQTTGAVISEINHPGVSEPCCKCQGAKLTKSGFFACH